MKLVCKNCGKETLVKTSTKIICTECKHVFPLQLLNEITVLPHVCEKCLTPIPDDPQKPLCYQCWYESQKHCISCGKAIPNIRNRKYCDKCNYKLFYEKKKIHK